MKILWICNVMLPAAARQLGRESTNKEGWLDGLCSVILERQQENGVELHVAFPVERELDGRRGTVRAGSVSFYYYGFYEDVAHAERYEKALETRLKQIMDIVEPDVLHCFGTEYSHTLAACRVFPMKNRILVGIQGLCAVYANTYFANLPKKTVHSVTLRDFLKKDSLIRQQEKFVQRGRMEKEAVGLAGNVTGRTDWDRHYTKEWNPKARYFAMNETLRPAFYEGKWNPEHCVPHSIFLSQGDYPIKGLHYMLQALPMIRRKYPDATVSVAGNSLVKDNTWKDRLKRSAYGRYLRSLLKEGQLEGAVSFLGKLNAGEMKEQYLKSSLFVCCSTIENSPNSLGEAMILGMPCVSADVGGIASIFRGGEDGILYEGFRTPENSFDNICNLNMTDEEQMEKISKSLADAVVEIWDNEDKTAQFCINARNHAKKTHDRERNYRKMIEIYAEIQDNAVKKQ